MVSARSRISGIKFHFHRDGIFSVWALNEQDIYQSQADIFCICRWDAPCTQIRWQSRNLCALLPAQLGKAMQLAKMKLLTLFFICSEHPCKKDTGTLNVHSLGCISTYVKAPCLQELIYLGILTPTACLVFHVVNNNHIVAKMLRSFGTFPPVCRICHRET